MDWKRFAMAACVLAASVAQAGLQLSTDGKSEYVIVVADDAIPAEATAAGELRDHLKEVTGADLPVLRESDLAGNDAPRILVGQTKLARQLLPELKWESLSNDGIVIRTVGRNLILAGGRPRGALYAVNTFLDQAVGIRWWTSDERTVPSRPTLEVSPPDTTYVPKFRYREVYHRDAMENTTFAARMKLNGQHNRISESHGGHYTIIGWCHTSFDLIPPGSYFESHPEWFAQIDGKRQTHTQLCVSDEAMWQEMAKNALRRVRKNPAAGIISISQQDAHGACQCDRCRAVLAEEGSEAGAWIRMVNFVAAEINKEFPDFLVETLAYQYTRKPPKVVRPSENVLVRLCSIECNFAKPLASDANKAFGDDLRRWSEIAPNLFIWNYVTSFHNYLIPHPNLDSLGDDLRFFRDHKVVGVFQQGDAFNPNAGDFLPLRTWVQAKLLWDPSLDQAKLIEEFLNGYFGAAAPHLAAYLRVINEPAKNPGLVAGCGNTSTDFLSDDAIAKASALFDQAQEAVAAQPQVLKRVKRERLVLDHVKLLRYDFASAAKAHPDNSEAALADYESKVRKWADDCNEVGVTQFSEMQGFPAYVPALLARGVQQIPPKLPPAGATLTPGSIDIQPDRFNLFRPGKVATLVDDPKASNGRAARMPGGTTEWGVQYHLSADPALTGPGPWTCYLVARVDAKASRGGAFAFGLHDTANDAYIARDAARLNIVSDGEYHTFGITVDTLKPTMYLWVAPPGNAAAVENVYVDRFFIQRRSPVD